MLGDVKTISENLWMVEGNLPEDFTQDMDRSNVLVYQPGNSLYLLDTGFGRTMARSIQVLIKQAGKLESFVLVNSHSHPDHIGNNHLIQAGVAARRSHFISREAFPRLDWPTTFIRYYRFIEQYYDPLDGYQVYRGKMMLVKLLRDFLTVFLGRNRAWKTALAPIFKQMKNGRHSTATMQALEDQPSNHLALGGKLWQGWNLGEGEVLVLEDRSHSPDQVLFYLPEPRVIYLADAAFHLIPTFPESNSYRSRIVLQNILTAVEQGEIQVLVNGHQEKILRGKKQITSFLEEILTDHQQFRKTLNSLLADEDGLTVKEIYQRLITSHRDNPAVNKYLELDFPRTPSCLWMGLLCTLLELGYEARGRRGKKRFYRRIDMPAPCSTHGYYCECQLPEPVQRDHRGEKIRRIK